MLDEATAFADPENEALLLQATEEGVYARLWNSYQAAQRWSLPTPAQTTQEDAP